MKKSTMINLMIIFGISIFAVPIIINESYKINSGYTTLWEAKDLLLYFGSVISAIGTIFIGMIAFKQNSRANDINDRLLRLQEINSIPFLHLDLSGSRIQCFRDREIDILIGLRNETSSVINILKVSQIKINSFTKEQLEIPFCKGWTTHYSVLPHQTKEINFFKESIHNEDPLVDISSLFLAEYFTQLICTVEIKLQFVNSNDIYIQKVEFYLNIFLPKDNSSKYKVDIYNIENSIEREENN